jgi:hypothetical protein
VQAGLSSSLMRFRSLPALFALLFSFQYFPENEFSHCFCTKLPTERAELIDLTGLEHEWQMVPDDLPSLQFPARASRLSSVEDQTFLNESLNDSSAVCVEELRDFIDALVFI